jgi:hypothetical protein
MHAAATVFVKSLVADKEHLDAKAGETLLLHGVSDMEALENILTNGFRKEYSGTNRGTLYGNGIYLTDDLRKALHYARPLKEPSSLTSKLGIADADVPGMCFVLVSKVLLGSWLSVEPTRTSNPYSSHLSGWRQPPFGRDWLSWG